MDGKQMSIIPKSLENYFSVQVGCLRFLDAYRFLSSGLDKLVKSINSFPILESNNIEDELYEKKLAYPYEYFTQSAFGNSDNFDKPPTLTKEDFWSTIKQSYPPDEEISGTQNIITKYDIKNGQELTMLYLKMDY